MTPTLRPLPALLLALAAACSGNAGEDAARRAIAPDSEPPTLTRLRAEPYSFTYNSGYTAPAREVVRDAAAWEAAWARVHGSLSPRPALPAFDPATEQMVIVALGQRNSGGYSILIDSVRAVAGKLEIHVTSSSPGPRCGVAAALSEPVDVARMRRSALPVTFVERAIATDCR